MQNLTNENRETCGAGGLHMDSISISFIGAGNTTLNRSSFALFHSPRESKATGAQPLQCELDQHGANLSEKKDAGGLFQSAMKTAA